MIEKVIIDRKNPKLLMKTKKHLFADFWPSQKCQSLGLTETLFFATKIYQTTFTNNNKKQMARQMDRQT